MPAPRDGMIPDREGRETLRLAFQRDEPSGLPLLGEAGALLELTLNFLPLPHSVVEFGCGKKASLILDLLGRHGVPVHGLKRGLILESDLSPEVLKQRDHVERPHALHVANPLHRRASLDDDSLRRMIRDEGFSIDTERALIRAGDFELLHVETVQFVVARSHIYPIIAFWDPESDETVDRVIDPTLDRERMFPVPEMRDYLHGPEALLFSAPMLGRFRLDPEYLTARQHRKIEELIPGTDSLEKRLTALDHSHHAALVRDLTGAAAGSIGDPQTWSYANNIRPSGDRAHDDVQKRDTGLGETLRAGMLQLRRDRPTALAREIDASRERLLRTAVEMEIRRRMARDAVWSGRKLEPLARLAGVVSSHLSLQRLAHAIRRGDALPLDPASPDDLRSMRGVAVRLRQRIERLALASTDRNGKIHAGALTPLFLEAACEMIAQMNRAGLTVFIDQVGNLHGLRIPSDQADPTGTRHPSPADLCVDAICLASHLDTASDAGKHDGRLGVMAGIEIARIARDLDTCFGSTFPGDCARGILMVTAFMGGGMTGSGDGVAMPGNAAVAGHAPVEAIHRMTHAAGEPFLEGLLGMLRFLETRRQQGRIHFANRFPDNGDPEAWIAACPKPHDFFTPHTYERHIEQGPGLNRAGVPLVLVDRAVGEFDAKTSRETRRDFEGRALDGSGQVLQLERGYGDSHNPNGAEKTADLLRGTLIQLRVTADFQLSRRPLQSTLYQMAWERVPEAWRRRWRAFDSRPLHDSGNVAPRSRTSIPRRDQNSSSSRGADE